MQQEENNMYTPTDNAKTVLERRYLLKDSDGNLTETPDEMMHRVANAIASVEEKSKRTEYSGAFYNILSSGMFLPNSPTLMNAGTPTSMLSACFVIPVADSMEDILQAVSNTGTLFKLGGGVGLNFSDLRPKGSFIHTTGGYSSGPVSFMRIFDTLTKVIAQGGKRRGALMGILSVEHPDIISFINAKTEAKRLTGFNLSVGITNLFMKAYKKNPNQVHMVTDPNTGEKKKLIDENGKPVTVKQIFDLITLRSWESGEPGVVFIDRLQEFNPIPSLFICCTNPCGEVPLTAWGSCNLGSINVSKFFNMDGSVNYNSLREVISLSVRFLDNVISVNEYPLQEIKDMALQTRNIGLGVMGFADLLFKIGIPYNSKEAIVAARTLMKFINETAHSCSEELGEEKGSFPLFEKSIWKDKYKHHRNGSCTVIAPTGSISKIAGCSGGIEPLFSPIFKHFILDKDTMYEVSPFLKTMLAERNVGLSDAEMKQIYDEGTVKNIGIIPEDVKKVFVCSHDVETSFHLKMQEAFQEHTDCSVSKTINLPHNATVETVRDVYKYAFKSKVLKGLTLYRDGSRLNQPMQLGETNNKKDKMTKYEWFFALIMAVEKNDHISPAVKIKQDTPFGTLHITLVFDKNMNEHEVFAQLGKSGDVAAADLEAICRLSSKLLQSKFKFDNLIQQLIDIGTSLSLPTAEGKVVSLPDGLARGLNSYKEIKLEVLNFTTATYTK
jgi:ribonucleoside-diphosphate reductase alpha chain